MTDWKQLLEGSSLGSTEARSLRDRVTVEEVEQVLKKARSQVREPLRPVNTATETDPNLRAKWFQETFARIVENTLISMRGQDRSVSDALICVLAGGHLLIDGPTLESEELAEALARNVQGSLSRVRCAPGLVGSELIGVTIYDQGTKRFNFYPGPVFVNVLVVHQIEHAPLSARLALFEVMRTGSATVDGRVHSVEEPFVAICTTDSSHQGSPSMPTQQAVEFLMRVSPQELDTSAIADALRAALERRVVENSPVISANALSQMISLAQLEVVVGEDVLMGLVNLMDASRRHPHLRSGIGVNAAVGAVRAAKVRAMSQGRVAVQLDDIGQLLGPVFAHRLELAIDTSAKEAGLENTLEEMWTAAISKVKPGLGLVAG